ncbi:MAG: acylphosphatase [Steroidobacteraceae bacterium]
MAARRIRICGRVQGVYFRASTAKRAIALGLRGYAENLEDGDVLVMAAGDPGALEKLAAWLRIGPPMARVDGVQAEPVDPASVAWPAGFQQR